MDFPLKIDWLIDLISPFPGFLVWMRNCCLIICGCIYNFIEERNAIPANRNNLSIVIWSCLICSGLVLIYLWRAEKVMSLSHKLCPDSHIRYFNCRCAQVCHQSPQTWTNFSNGMISTEKVDLERRNRSAISCRDPIIMYRHFLFNLFLSRLIHPKGGLDLGTCIFWNSIAGSPLVP